MCILYNYSDLKIKYVLCAYVYYIVITRAHTSKHNKQLKQHTIFLKKATKKTRLKINTK